jgi:hypothetical protein
MSETFSCIIAHRDTFKEAVAEAKRFGADYI